MSWLDKVHDWFQGKNRRISELEQQKRDGNDLREAKNNLWEVENYLDELQAREDVIRRRRNE